MEYFKSYFDSKISEYKKYSTKSSDINNYIFLLLIDLFNQHINTNSTDDDNFLVLYIIDIYTDILTLLNNNENFCLEFTKDNVFLKI